MPIFSTSSLTDMPLVRFRELMISSRWVRPISEIKRWFIGLKWLEWNESVGLYTPRSLIRKPKIYTTVGPKRNYKKRGFVMTLREQKSHEKRDKLSPTIQRLDSPPFLAQSVAFLPVSRLPSPLRFRV